MKNHFHLILAAAAAVIVLVMCATADAASCPDAQTIADALLSQSIFDETLLPLAEDEITARVVMEEGVTGLMYVSEDDEDEVVAVFCAPSRKTAVRMVSYVNAYLAAEGTPDSDVVLLQKDTSVILCVSTNPDTAKRVIEDVFNE